MTLRLSDAQLDLVSRVQTTLLSPRDAPTVAAWVEEVVDATDRLFSTDRTAMILPHAEGLEFAGGPGLTPFLPAMARVLGAVEEGAIHFTEPHVEAAHAVRRARRIEVWSNPMLAELTGTPIELSLIHI